MVDQHLNINKFLLFLMTFFAQIENAVLKAEHFCKIFTQNNFSTPSETNQIGFQS